jgi:hypothetical protein
LGLRVGLSAGLCLVATLAETAGWDSRPYQMTTAGWDSRPYQMTTAGWGSRAYQVAQTDGSESRPYQREAWPVVRRYPVPEARQAVAVDATHFYAITNRRIARYEKATGRKVAEWQDADDGPFIHLNSGIVIDGALYAAHSNYPGVPMVSSIEVWDTATLRHQRSIPVGTGRGSATWIDRRHGAWWVMYAHYPPPNGEPGKGPEYSVLVRYDTEWRETGAWAFPKAVVRRWDGMSSSGGVWMPDGRLLTAGHHAPELHVLRLPSAGATLVLDAIVPVESEGQGIALDPTDPSLLWSIQRRTGEVLVSRMRW